MAAMVKQMAQMTMMDKVRNLSGLGRAAAANPAARLVTPRWAPASGCRPRRTEKLRKQREKEGADAAVARGGIVSQWSVISGQWSERKATGRQNGRTPRSCQRSRMGIDCRGVSEWSSSNEIAGTSASTLLPDLRHGLSRVLRDGRAIEELGYYDPMSRNPRRRLS